MAAKLNKKYFGNRNIGTGGDQTTGPLENSQNYSDDRIGGEGIASINWSNYGSWLSSAGGALAPLAGLALPAPTLPGGVQATWTNYFGASDVTTGAGKAGLVVGNTYGYADIPGLVVTVATISGTNATFTVTAPGSTTALLTDLTGVNLTRASGAGAATFLVDIKLKIVNTVINEKGSGYTGSETFTVTLANSATGTVPAGTIVLTTDNGIPYSAGNQENAIIPYAYVTGGSRKVADIIRQVGARRYKVRTADGIMNCSLKTSAASNAAGEMDLTATDSSGKTYYVKKLTGHKATLVQYGTAGHEFDTDTAVQWTFGAAVLDTSVTIANA